ncbi:SHOCT domain-containing protein [Glutamicibacter sp.]|uniref:SHOCT domain-containing protein n=1 Tax=Glutamicibacter sp. TaxID=1931995 RepID=UPI0028BF0BB1|nr:SHOCT domain-containing protein [Glutamicibacter sp.]
MPFRRMGRPGLIGTAARTAVIAGTAQAVGGRVAANQQRKAQAQVEQEQYAAAQEQARIDASAQAAVAAQAQPAAVAPAASEDNLLEQLQQLATMKASGILTDQEFAEAKAKLLS